MGQRVSEDVFIRVPRIAQKSLYLYRVGIGVVGLAIVVALLFHAAAPYACFGSLALMLIFIWISHFLQARIVRQVLRTDRQMCMGCGYDLRATINLGQCPECGAFFDPQTLKDEWDAWLVPGHSETTERAPHPPYARKLKRWYLLGLAGLPVALIVHLLLNAPGVAFAIVISGPLVAVVVSGLRFGALIERVEAAKFKVCMQCGYDLQELPPSGPCPECGTKYAIDTNVLLWKNWCMVRVRPRSR